jgi:hypothetical protein
MLIAAVTGFVVIVSYFIPYTETWGEELMIWFDILAAVAFILGGGSLLRMNLEKVSSRRPGWGYAAVTVTAFLVTLYVGMTKWGVMPSEAFPESAWSGQFDEDGSALGWIYSYIYKPLAATMFALLAFFVASAAFRAFRAKNTEATILLSSAFIVLLGRTYTAEFLTGWIDDIDTTGWPVWRAEYVKGMKLDRLALTIFNDIGTPVLRAIMIGVALGTVSTSLKVLLGVDRSYLGSDRD